MLSCQSLGTSVLPAMGALPCRGGLCDLQHAFRSWTPSVRHPITWQRHSAVRQNNFLFGTHLQCHRAGSSPYTRAPPCHRICCGCRLRVHPWLQGCNALTDAGLATLADMTSLTLVNLQDCRQVTGAASA